MIYVFKLKFVAFTGTEMEVIPKYFLAHFGASLKGILIKGN
jgi:hypothetical protein